MLPSFLLSVQHVCATLVYEGPNLGGQSGVSISLGLRVEIIGRCPFQLPRVSPRVMHHLPPPWRWHRCPRRSTGGKRDLPEGASHRLIAVHLCPSGTPGSGHNCPWCVLTRGIVCSAPASSYSCTPADRRRSRGHLRGGAVSPRVRRSSGANNTGHGCQRDCVARVALEGSKVEAEE
jgi:hypothetical protein